MSTEPSTVFRALADVAVLRCSAGVVDLYPDGDAEWGDPTAIGALWSDVTLQEAVLLASPVLATEVERLVGGGAATIPEKKRRRIHKGLLKYAIRLSSRATPFGTFAGLAMLPLGDREPILAADHIRHVRISSELGRRLSATARTDGTTCLYANPAVVERGDRYVALVTRRKSVTESASVRATDAVRIVLQFAAEPRTRGTIEDRLALNYPEVPHEAIGTLVTQLADAEILLSTADRSAFDADILDRLPDSAPGVGEIRRAVNEYSAAGSDDAVAKLGLLLAACGDGNGDTQRNLHVDLELTATGSIPARVRRDGSSVVRVLSRTSMFPGRNPVLDDFCRTFDERYGDCLVPFVRVIDPELGIGYPLGYENPDAVGGVSVESLAQQQDLRGRLLERARNGLTDTVDIVDSDLSDLPVSGGIPSAFDVFLGLSRDSAGLRCSLGSVGLNHPGGRAVGRFTTVIPSTRDHARHCVQWDSLYWAATTPNGASVISDVDYVSGRDTINNVGSTIPLYPSMLAINSVLPSGAQSVLRLDDIYLGLAGGRVRTYLRDGTPVRFQQLTMTVPAMYAFPVRLLHELSSDEFVRPHWSWGGVEDVVHFLPEVRYRDVVIAERRWRYPKSARRDREALAAWLQETRVSRYITIGELDNRLHLDTLHPLHRDLLIEEISRGRDWLQAAMSPDRIGMVRDESGRRHCAEVVVTVPMSVPKTSRQLKLNRPLFDPDVDAERLLAPGGDWTYIATRLDRALHDKALTEFDRAFPDLRGSWYFVRYREKEAGELRIRINRPVSCLDRVLEWLVRSRVSGLIGEYSLPIHHRELERYGGLESFGNYERFFCRETAAVLPLLPIMSRDRADVGQPIRDGITSAAAVLGRWLSGVAPTGPILERTVQLAVDGYRYELGAKVHRVKAVLRGRKIMDGPGTDAIGVTVSKFWAEDVRGVALRTPEIVQSASHLLCNRMGLSRTEEFAALWLVKTDLEAKERAHV